MEELLRLTPLPQLSPRTGEVQPSLLTDVSAGGSDWLDSNTSQSHQRTTKVGIQTTPDAQAFGYYLLSNTSRTHPGKG